MTIFHGTDKLNNKIDNQQVILERKKPLMAHSANRTATFHPNSHKMKTLNLRKSTMPITQLALYTPQLVSRPQGPMPEETQSKKYGGHLPVMAPCLEKDGALEEVQLVNDQMIYGVNDEDELYLRDIGAEEGMENRKEEVEQGNVQDGELDKVVPFPEAQVGEGNGGKNGVGLGLIPNLTQKRRWTILGSNQYLGRYKMITFYESLSPGTRKTKKTGTRKTKKKLDGHDLIANQISQMEKVNIVEDVENDSLNKMIGIGGDDDTQDSLLIGGGSSVVSKPPSKGQEESTASGSGASYSM
ncbi:hypothetical protein GIB67_040050 [Kingdonia uniflora]|uniref:Uncharacterized protein n=1 Tax=Kingdonia uniflora TaxID=39325 RepID=A0A7J7MUG8_9MAGN|nr:hypothetical protein GIB67_040050 [Kingdonia uniflora]